jgi:RNA polymerase sigma-70 factor (ECF subfamily)
LEFIRNKSRKKRFAFVKSIFHKENEEFEIEDFIHPGIILENKERAGILFKAIDRLPEKQKTAFILNKIEYLRYDEISEVMNLSKSSVESLIHRAKSNLQKYLYDFYQNN